jgi:hypothetical protein
MNKSVAKKLRAEAMSYAIPRVKRIVFGAETDLQKVFKARLKKLKSDWLKSQEKERRR